MSPGVKQGPDPESSGSDYRIVDFDVLHKIDARAKAELVRAVDAQPGQVILDGMQGYGAVASWILQEAGGRGFTPEVYGVDESLVQVERARSRLPDIDPAHILQADIRESGFADNTFDAVVIKAGIHEVSQREQGKLFAEVFRILKPGGKFVVWEVKLDETSQPVFQDFIRKKDELSGFEQLVEDRYFPRYDEIQKLFKAAGFTDIKDCYLMPYVPSVQVRQSELISRDLQHRIEQKGALDDTDMQQLQTVGAKRAAALVRYLRERFAPHPSVQKKLHFEDLGTDVRFHIERVIMAGRKPE